MLSAGCSLPGRGPVSPEPVESRVTATSGLDGATALDQGANGPVPVIVVDQFGYRTKDQKVAVLRRPVTGYDSGSTYTPGSEIKLIEASGGARVFSAGSVAWNDGEPDPDSGDMAWWFDFSEVTRPGRYYVQDPENGARSAEFTIGDTVYRDVLTQALRTFFHQRAGQEKPAELAGSAWADGASHLGPGQDSQSRSWLRRDDASTEHDLRGGWYDAGDYNKYTAWHASYVLGLLHTYVEHPDLVGDDLRIPESGNGVSDLLDEIVWGLDWLTRMQESDGSILCVQRLDSASPPSAASGPSYFGPPTTNASFKASAAFAYAATVFASTGIPALADRSADLTQRAQSAWEWAAANPTVTYYNNDETRQPGSGGLAGGQQEPDARGRAASKLEAAVYLYGQTRDRQFRDYVEATFQTVLPDGSQTQWTVNEQETLLHYASLPGVTPRVSQETTDSYLRALDSGPQFMKAVQDGVDPYRAPIDEYTWGSNQSKAQMGRMFALAAVHGLDAQPADQSSPSGPALSAAEDYVHYLHGVNPLGLVYLTNMGDAGAEHSASTLYHLWFAEGSRWDSATANTPGPAPGFLVGGPNPYYSLDPCCADTPACAGTREADLCRMDPSPPLGQPAMKSYLQFNDGWPANSWEVTENSNGYQVAYVRLLAAFADWGNQGGDAGTGRVRL
ncbi:MAG: glycoside hydrolase family 9 protein [Propionicimonas sp.]